MRWQWEELTAPDFARAKDEVRGVCVVPIGCLEKHGEHLPLGTDAIAVHALATRAAEKEPAIVFPFYFFGQIHEAKHCPGTMAIRMDLAMGLLENICDEIARNGLKKIILMNGHGGNGAFLGHFARTMLERERDYVVHLMELGDYMFNVTTEPAWKEQMETAFDHHGGEIESSVMLDICPDLVKMEAIPADPAHGQPQKRLEHLQAGYRAIGWYANYPNHYAGDARPATAQKGAWLTERFVEKIAACIRMIKEDTATAGLLDEFFSRVQH